MKAVCWHGVQDMRVDTVDDPKILNPRDAIIRVTSTAICGSDLHLYGGFMPGMQAGDIVGHEFMGEVVELGSGVTNLSVGQRVVVPFTIACGQCFFCDSGYHSLCDNSNPNAAVAEKMWGQSPAGLFGYTHILGGYAGGQAEYVRVPYADVGPMVVPDSVSDEQALFLTDIFPTGYQAIAQCDMQPGDVVAVWGCGPVGQFAIASAKMLGAGRVIAIDTVAERLLMAEQQHGVETLDARQTGNTLQIVEALRDMTAGRGPDICVDAVGLEAHGVGLEYWYDNIKQSLMMETARPIVLRQAIMACRKAGTVSIPGVYGGVADKIPVGALMNKALTIKTGQTHVQHYLKPLMDHVERGDIDPSFVITHRTRLDDAPEAYRMFQAKRDNCVKVVMQP